MSLVAPQVLKLETTQGTSPAAQGQQASETDRKAHGCASDHLSKMRANANNLKVEDFQSVEQENDGKLQRVFTDTHHPKKDRGIFGFFKPKEEQAAAVNTIEEAGALSANVEGLKTQYAEARKRYEALSNEIAQSEAATQGPDHVGTRIANRLDAVAPDGVDRSFEELIERGKIVSGKLDEAVEAGAIEENLLKKIELPAPNNGKAAETLMGRAISTFLKQTTRVEQHIREYLEEIEGRNKKMGQLDQLKQRLRTSSDKVDWKNDPELRELVLFAKSCGAVLPEGDVWGEKERATLKENVDGVVDGLMNTNETANFRLTLCQNTFKMLWELLSDTMKVFVNIMERFSRNLSTH